MRPPRTSWRWSCRAAADGSTCWQRSDGSGADRPRPRWGRWRLQCSTEVQDVKKLPPPGDQEMVQALPAYGANPALGNGVGVRRLNRRADDLGAGSCQMSSKARVNLLSRSRIRNRTTGASSASATAWLRACWATHAPVGLAVTPARCTRRLCSWMKNNTYSRCRNTVSTVRKSQARMPAAWRRRNDRHVVDPAARYGAGWRPLARRTLAMELAETRQPRCSSSPQMRW